MLNEQQFGKINPKKIQGPSKPKKPKVPGQTSRGGSGGYKFLPVAKSQEERDLMEVWPMRWLHRSSLRDKMEQQVEPELSEYRVWVIPRNEDIAWSIGKLPE